jgi:hypothetical protein
LTEFAPARVAWSRTSPTLFRSCSFTEMGVRDRGTIDPRGLTRSWRCGDTVSNLGSAARNAGLTAVGKNRLFRRLRASLLRVAKGNLGFDVFELRVIQQAREDLLQ